MNQQLEKVCIEYGVATRSMEGESVCGDVHVVKPFEPGLLIAVIDGAGHGIEAMHAATTAANVLEHNASEPLIPLLERCHRALLNTRGAVMTMISVRPAENSMTWLGVGSVNGCLLRTNTQGKLHSETILLRGGIVGYQLPPVKMSIKKIAPGDWFVLATDGIRSGFCDSFEFNQPPQKAAERILEQHFKGTDDALVLAARYIGTDDER